MKARCIFSASAIALVLALSPTAGADTTTLGNIVEPVGATAVDCNALGEPVVIAADTSAYTVGSAGSVVASWSVNATGDGGATETLYALSPDGATYTVVGTDTETIPASIPASGTVTFTPAKPILTQAGDTFGVSTTGSGHAYCAWDSTDTTDEGVVLLGSGAIAGQSLLPYQGGVGGPYVQGLRVDLAVTLGPGVEDVAVSTTTGPNNPVVGSEALLSSSVTNDGPIAGPTTFTDAVPAGLAIDAVAAAGGTCATAGQTVTCSFAGLAVGASAPVEIVVTPGAAQSYSNTVSVADADGATDPNPANNSATAVLLSAAAAPASLPRACVAANLKGLSEKVVKRLLPSLGCRLGKVKKAGSKTVAKGDVISLNPGSGSHPAGTKVTLTVSSGKPKARRKH